MRYRPLIGMTTNLTGTGPTDGLVQGGRAYVEALAAAGAAPVLLPPLAEPEMAEAMLAVLDGLLVTGGRDVHPWRYGEPAHAAAELLDPRRDAWDQTLLARALACPHLSILGICLGIQELNVALGGSLTQHVPDLGLGLEHRAPETGDRLHGLVAVPGTRLAGILGVGEVQVTTRHHQAVARLGGGARVAAYASDGLVEAIEWGGAERFVVGVQWHPERNADSRESQALFAALVQACVRGGAAVAERRRQVAPGPSGSVVGHVQA